jgi:hypothetical protein
MEASLREAYGRFIPLLILFAWVPSLFSSMFFITVAPEIITPLLLLFLVISCLSVIRAKTNKKNGLWLLYWIFLVGLHVTFIALGKVYLFMIFFTILFSWPLILSTFAGLVISVCGLILEIVNHRAEPDAAINPC